ncbi:hypothetical protein HDU90_003009 [Geranomyces variabilis]|nr:hypothetical protein HDU90_003009 [Geranomyces variabilis]
MPKADLLDIRCFANEKRIGAWTPPQRNILLAGYVTNADITNQLFKEQQWKDRLDGKVTANDELGASISDPGLAR